MWSERLDPTLRAWLEAVQALEKPPMCTLTPEEGRAAALEMMKTVCAAPEPVARVEDIRIRGPEAEIPVRVYTPESLAPRPGLVFFHGGGWVLCGLETHDVACRAIARRAGAVVVSVDYRLAPEHRFPAAVNDCYAALEWTAANAGPLDIDGRRISVGGDSAGGNLAAAVALKSRDERGPAIAGQAMVYPVTNLASFDTPSYEEFADGYQLTRASMEWFRNHYLQRPEDGLHPYASPLLAPDLEGLPPALVLTAECDPLRDEGEAFAGRLEKAGVAVTRARYEGMIHPFFSLSGVCSRAFDSFQQVADFVRAA
ncbi:MAG: alpha/beta hydrolase [Bryobacterales bacterium]|nr:alpha/beta hydrolase [Bryobacterales bacterium]